MLIVTHDRYFLDQVATQILAFHVKPGEEGHVSAFAGLSQWEEWHAAQGPATRASRAAALAAVAVEAAPAPAPRKKLSFNLQREWDGIEARIADAEGKLSALEAEAQSPAVVSDAARLVALAEHSAAARAEVDRLYARWAELETLLSA